MSVNIALLTVTDTRTLETDKSGNILVEKIKKANHNLTERKICKDNKDDIKNIVHGINNDIINNDDILGAASCTTNAIVPTLKVLNDEYDIKSGHIESVHSYTNDQNLIDNFHKKERRGRSAALNIVITETGAGKAVGQVLPELLGKLTANAVRVPTPNVSLAIMSLELGKEVTVEALNDFLRQKAFHSDLKEQTRLAMYKKNVKVFKIMLGF